jgi:hypothetical protein
MEEGLAARRWAFDNMEAKKIFYHGYLQAEAEHRRRIAS